MPIVSIFPSGSGGSGGGGGNSFRGGFGYASGSSSCKGKI